ncbi:MULTISPECIES: helix-turn-helix domain-containing protein [Pseudomonas syringae group]|uniref:helix-turn-helix domain-containing protein n=1 Tax=Pseudomonas syringae group TaxID=136849 RepID=UPI0009B6E627|nr:MULTISPECIES: helix-turn-helix transcriptional regulator [Pseudomonas syringae group]MBN3471276.1 helix-turn-helix transcriptional regulator [Pseudomonas savastanoi pv. phaseolicola]MBN3478296.1 helix-turn-helix transcriptional regulator [Pseudomonas savastanoi pv. phaseolicola]UZS66426.1 helix-turn-helix domain-containing protein [Pseudomonas syringae]
MDIAAAFGKVLREARLSQKVTQEALAAQAGLQRNYVSLMERGHHQPTLATIFSLAAALNSSPLELVKSTMEKISACE